MFGSALIIAISAFIVTYCFKDGWNKASPKMLILACGICLFFGLYVVGIFK